MKKTHQFYLFLLLILVFAGCTDNYERNLGDGYFLTGYSSTTEIFKKINEKEDEEILLGEIVDYSFDDNFILIYREVSDKVKNHFNDHSLSEIMRGGETNQYWIINKKKGISLGPFRKDEYFLKRNELGIPSKLKLK